MTLSFVGYASGLASAPGTINVTLPGGSAAGDLIVGGMVADIGASTTPSGFTLLDAPTASAQNEVRGFSKTLSGTDISNNFVTMPGDPNFNGIRYSLWVWHSTGGTPTVDGHSGRTVVDSTTPTVCDSGTITTTSANDGVCVMLGCRNSGTAWSATPGGVTTDQNAPGGYTAVFAYHYTFVGPGTTSNQTATNDQANGGEAAVVIGVADAGGGPVITYIRQATMRGS